MALIGWMIVNFGSDSLFKLLKSLFQNNLTRRWICVSLRVNGFEFIRRPANDFIHSRHALFIKISFNCLENYMKM